MNPELIQYLREGSAITILLWFIVGGVRGTWVLGRHMREVISAMQEKNDLLREDRDFWREAALTGLEGMKESVRLAERRHR